MIVKIFTMVKDEEDIIEYWIKYHGKMFGFDNIYIVDNMSTDGTYEKIVQYKNHGIHIYREEDYKKKGIILSNIINTCGNKYDIIYPLDSDEFIVYYDKKSNTIIPENTKLYLENLIQSNEFKNNNVFKANYCATIINSNNKYGYENAALQNKYGLYADYKNMAKTFFNAKKWTMSAELDHGNHFKTNNYVVSDLVLVHYHCRNVDQLKKKVINNVSGFDYSVTNIEELKRLVANDCAGKHHVTKMIKILNNTFGINTNDNRINNINCIDLSPLIKVFENL